jgi:hypothetical protein
MPSDLPYELDLGQLGAYLPAIRAGREASASREAAIRRFCEAGRWRLCAIADAAGVSHQYVSKVAKRARVDRPADPPVSSGGCATTDAVNSDPVSRETPPREWSRFDWIEFWLECLADGDTEPLDDIDGADAASILALAADQHATLQAGVAAELHRLAATIEAAR